MTGEGSRLACKELLQKQNNLGVRAQEMSESFFLRVILILSSNCQSNSGRERMELKRPLSARDFTRAG